MAFALRAGADLPAGNQLHSLRFDHHLTSGPCTLAGALDQGRLPLPVDLEVGHRQGHLPCLAVPARARVDLSASQHFDLRNRDRHFPGVAAAGSLTNDTGPHPTALPIHGQIIRAQLHHPPFAFLLCAGADLPAGNQLHSIRFDQHLTSGPCTLAGALDQGRLSLPVDLEVGHRQGHLPCLAVPARAGVDLGPS